MDISTFIAVAPPRLAIWLNAIRHTEAGRLFIDNLVFDIQAAVFNLNTLEQTLAAHDQGYPPIADSDFVSEYKNALNPSSSPRPDQTVTVAQLRRQKELRLYSAMVTFHLAPLQDRDAFAQAVENIQSDDHDQEEKEDVTFWIMKTMGEICAPFTSGSNPRPDRVTEAQLARVIRLEDLYFMLKADAIDILQPDKDEDPRAFRQVLLDILIIGDWREKLKPDADMRGGGVYSWVTLRRLLNARLNDPANRSSAGATPPDLSLADVAVRFLGLYHLSQSDTKHRMPHILLALDYPDRRYTLYIPTAFDGIANPLYRSRRVVSGAGKGWGETIQYPPSDPAQPGLPEMLCPAFQVTPEIRIRFLGMVTGNLK